MSDWRNRLKGRMKAAMDKAHLKAARDKARAEGRDKDWPQDARREPGEPARKESRRNAPSPELTPPGLPRRRERPSPSQKQREAVSEAEKGAEGGAVQKAMVERIRQTFERVRARERDGWGLGPKVDRDRGRE